MFDQRFVSTIRWLFLADSASYTTNWISLTLRIVRKLLDTFSPLVPNKCVLVFAKQEPFFCYGSLEVSYSLCKLQSTALLEISKITTYFVFVFSSVLYHLKLFVFCLTVAPLYHKFLSIFCSFSEWISATLLVWLSHKVLVVSVFLKWTLHFPVSFGSLMTHSRKHVV